jgi:hypothetical protein
VIPVKTTIIYTNPSSTNDTSDNEDSKLSYWLEKLHVQGEQMRTDNNRREQDSLEAAKVKITHEEEKNIAQSGINQHTKEVAAKLESDTFKVNDLVKKSNRQIISISSTFPWDLFPSVIEVEESRVTFKFNQFLSSQSHSVDIRDISNIFIESSVFFSTLQVVSRTYIQNDIKIGNLNKAKAKKVQRIIEGLRTLKENNINTSNYEIKELISKIEEFHIRHK